MAHHTNYNQPGYKNTHHMGNSQYEAQMQAQINGKYAQKTNVHQALQMFRDQIGAVLNVSERLLYSLGKIKSPDDFQYHAYSPERLVEWDSDTAAYKLLVLFKYLVTFHEEILEKYPHEAHEIKHWNVNLEASFSVSADYYAALANSLPPDRQLEKDLLMEIFHRIFKKTYTPLDEHFVARLKTAIKARSHMGSQVRPDHSGMMGYMHKTNQNLDTTVEYMKNNRHKQPNSAFEPATRDSSASFNGAVNYIGNKPQWTRDSAGVCQNADHRWYSANGGALPSVYQPNLGWTCCSALANTAAQTPCHSEDNQNQPGTQPNHPQQPAPQPKECPTHVNSHCSACMVAEESRGDGTQGTTLQDQTVIPKAPPATTLNGGPGDKFRRDDQTQDPSISGKTQNRFDSPAVHASAGTGSVWSS